jgi:hypothetical protein
MEVVKKCEPKVRGAIKIVRRVWGMERKGSSWIMLFSMLLISHYNHLHNHATAAVYTHTHIYYYCYYYDKLASFWIIWTIIYGYIWGDKERNSNRHIYANCVICEVINIIIYEKFILIQYLNSIYYNSITLILLHVLLGFCVPIMKVSGICSGTG